MGVANTLLKGWYEHRFVPRSDCAIEQALAASVYKKRPARISPALRTAAITTAWAAPRQPRAKAPSGAGRHERSARHGMYPRCQRALRRLGGWNAPSAHRAARCVGATLAAQKGRAGRAHGRSVRTIPAAHGVCAARFTAEGIRAGNPPHRRRQNRRGALSGRVRWTDARGPGTRLAHCPL